MEILHWPNKVSFLAIDVDETIYPKSELYSRHQRQVELTALSEFWYTSEQEALTRLKKQSELLEARLQRKPSAAETIRSFEGLSQDWIVKVRSERWHPELFLSHEPGLPEKILRLTDRYQVAFASTSPRVVIERIFRAVGFSSLLTEALVFGGGDAEPKPSPDIYIKITQAFGLPACEGLSVGDRFDFDAMPALKAGMGAVVVSGIQDFQEVVNRLLEAR